MLVILEKKQLSQNELDEFLTSGRGSRNTPYREILELMASQPIGFKVKFKVQNGFKFHAPYTSAENMGFSFSYKTVAKNIIEMVKIKPENKNSFDGTFTNTIIDIFGSDKQKLPVFQYTGHGSMPKIINAAFKNIGDEAIILANSDKTIRTNANKQGIAVSINQMSKSASVNGMNEYKTTRIDADNSYVRAARRRTS
jgi:hypothetical protein